MWQVKQDIKNLEYTYGRNVRARRVFNKILAKNGLKGVS